MLYLAGTVSRTHCCRCRLSPMRSTWNRSNWFRHTGRTGRHRLCFGDLRGQVLLELGCSVLRRGVAWLPCWPNVLRRNSDILLLAWMVSDLFRGGAVRQAGADGASYLRSSQLMGTLSPCLSFSLLSAMRAASLLAVDATPRHRAS